MMLAKEPGSSGWMWFCILFFLVSALTGCRTGKVSPTETATPYPSPYDNLKVGVPGKSDKLIDRPGYALGFLCYHKQPGWVQYHLTDKQALTKVAKRKDVFKEDPDIPGGSATLADYKGSGYDRGHLAPAADMAYSVQTMSDSFYMSNMSPQKPKFNRGIWKKLESQVRQFIIDGKDVYVVTGPILPEQKQIVIGAGKVTVPQYFYKVVYVKSTPQKMIGFVLPNEESHMPLQTFAVTVDHVESLTGLNFFSSVPQPEQDRLEATITVSDWNWTK